jgi:hypothetical protein
MVTVQTPYYRTNDGFGVGSRVPRGRCYKVGGKCQFRWHGFTSSQEGHWSKTVRQADADIVVSFATKQHKVAEISMFRLPGRAATLAEARAITRTILTFMSRRLTVGSIRLSTASPSWAVARVTTPELDSLPVVLHRKAGRWTISNYGDDQIGCGIRRAVQVNLNLNCFPK